MNPRRSVSPGNVELFNDLGIMYLKINEVDRAFEKLQEAAVIEPRHTNSLLALGAIFQTKNESEAALNTYRNIPNLQDESFELWNNIGMCFYRKNKLIAVMFPLCFQVHFNILNFPFFATGDFLFEEISVAFSSKLQFFVQFGCCFDDSSAVCLRIPMFRECCQLSSGQR
jgi:tetratricopeptide (TPR) repeat protein